MWKRDPFHIFSTTGGMGGPIHKISQKDSWNPADIWLLNQSARDYRKFIWEVRNADTVANLNRALINAYNGNVIVGISLKKADINITKKRGVTGDIKFERVNLQLDTNKLPLVDYLGWKLDFGWNKTSLGGF